MALEILAMIVVVVGVVVVVVVVGTTTRTSWRLETLLPLLTTMGIVVVVAVTRVLQILLGFDNNSWGCQVDLHHQHNKLDYSCSMMTKEGFVGEFLW